MLLSVIEEKHTANLSFPLARKGGALPELCTVGEGMTLAQATKKVCCPSVLLRNHKVMLSTCICYAGTEHAVCTALNQSDHENANSWRPDCITVMIHICNQLHLVSHKGLLTCSFCTFCLFLAF